MTDMTRPKFYDEEGTEKQVIGKDSDGNVEDITVDNITVENITATDINSENITANAIKPQSININQNNLTIDSTGKLDSKANINTSEAVNCKTMKATEGINVNDKFTVGPNGTVITKGAIKSDSLKRYLHTIEVSTPFAYEAGERDFTCWFTIISDHSLPYESFNNLILNYYPHRDGEIVIPCSGYGKQITSSNITQGLIIFALRLYADASPSVDIAAATYKMGVSSDVGTYLVMEAAENLVYPVPWGSITITDKVAEII